MTFDLGGATGSGGEDGALASATGAALVAPDLPLPAGRLARPPRLRAAPPLPDGFTFVPTVATFLLVPGELFFAAWAGFAVFVTLACVACFRTELLADLGGAFVEPSVFPLLLLFALSAMFSRPPSSYLRNPLRLASPPRGNQATTRPLLPTKGSVIGRLHPARSVALAKRPKRFSSISFRRSLKDLMWTDPGIYQRQPLPPGEYSALVPSLGHPAIPFDFAQPGIVGLRGQGRWAALGW